MKGPKKSPAFLYRIRNRQFQKLFVKNWIQVFVCIVLPLALCIGILQSFSAESLHREVDSAARRSTGNTVGTIEALLNEICAGLKKKAVDENFVSFFRMERSEPRRYFYIETVNNVLKQINADYRDNLYDSVDVYTQVGDYIVASPHTGMSRDRFPDQSLLETFWSLVDDGAGQGLYAAPRFAVRKEGQEPKWVITIYYVRAVEGEKKAFVSASLDGEKLIRYIAPAYNRFQGTYLIVDDNNRVILDTAGELNNICMELPEEASASTVTVDINGQSKRIFWMPLELFGWKCVQIIPTDEFEESNIRLRELVLTILTIGFLAAIVLSYNVTVRLFRPIEAILRLLENPSEQVRIGDENGEIQYLLVSILDLFQKNIMLEQEQVERVIALRSARAKALQEQMTPHFLNNILQAINWNAIMETGNENSVTSRSILLLAEILNARKEQSSNITTVAEEVEYTEKYVELECLRYGPNIHCVFHVTPEAGRMPIPCISLQTLVENSISHGLQPHNACGCIYVSIEKTEQQGLHIMVEDDGIGIEESVIQNIYSMLEKEYIYIGEHLGIVNLFQRFRLIYGKKCVFKISKSAYGGACVEIETPELPELWIQYHE